MDFDDANNEDENEEGGYGGASQDMFMFGMDEKEA